MTQFDWRSTLGKTFFLLYGFCGKVCLKNAQLRFQIDNIS